MKVSSLMAWAIRLFLGTAFVAGGLPKLLGQPWHRQGQEPWIVPFFDALANSGIYWNFLGFCQMAVGILIIIPRTAALGAVVYFPVMLNVFVIAVSLPFYSSVIAVTGAMLAGNLYLIGLAAGQLQPLLAAQTCQPPTDGARRTRRLMYVASLTACLVLVFHLGLAFVG